MKLNNSKKGSIKKVIYSFKYAMEGIIASFKSEKNMKIHVLAMLVVIIIGFILRLNLIEWCICIILFALVISGELFNTAIETIVDMVMPEKNDMAKLAKDVSAGAVFVLAIAAVVIGMVIFIPKIMLLM